MFIHNMAYLHTHTPRESRALSVRGNGDCKQVSVPVLFPFRTRESLECISARRTISEIQRCTWVPFPVLFRFGSSVTVPGTMMRKAAAVSWI